MSDEVLWESVQEQLRWHIKRKQGDQTWLDALNRISRKVLTGKGISNCPHLGPTSCGLHRVTRTPEELASINRHHDRKEPAFPSTAPVVLLAYGGQEYIIDGHNRINLHLARQRSEAMDVILLTPAEGLIT